MCYKIYKGIQEGMNDSAGDGLMVVTLGKASKCEEQTAQELEAKSINPTLAKVDGD